jgi:hypothetical protein
LTSTARINLIKLQEQLPEMFMINPRFGNSMMVNKAQMLGAYEYQIHTALTKNKVIALNNLMNLLTSIQNYRGTQDPAWLNVNLPPLIKKYIQEYDLGINIDEVYPQQIPGMGMQQQQPMMPGMGGGPKGLPGMQAPQTVEEPTLAEPAVYA